MLTYVELKELQAGIATVIKSLSSRPTLPILEGIYIEAGKEGLLLRCSDLTLQIDCMIPADVREEGAFVLPGRLFSEMVRKISGETLEMRMDEKSVQLKAGRSKMSLQYMNAKDFPNMDSNKNAVDINIPGDELKEMIRQTVFATAQDDNKPILTGVFCEMEENTLNLVALDGFRLALRKTSIEWSQERVEAVIPAKSLIEIGRTLLDDPETVTFSLSKTHLSLQLGKVKIISRLLDGDYIKYKAILPTEHVTRVRVNREELLDSIERAILLAREGNNNLVRFTIKDNILALYANSALGRMDEEIEVNLNGESIQIAFNAKYFSDALKTLNDEEVYLDLRNNVSPCIVRPIFGDHFYFLILPVRVFS